MKKSEKKKVEKIIDPEILKLKKELQQYREKIREVKNRIKNLGTKKLTAQKSDISLTLYFD